MKVTMNLPPHVYGRLATIADEHHVRIGDLIVESIESLLEPRPKPGKQRVVTARLEERMRVLAALNRSQGEIAVALRLSPTTVANAAKRMGLQTLRTRGKAS